MGLSSLPPKLCFLLFCPGVLTGPLQLLSVVLERTHARPVPREIWWSVAGITPLWLVLQCGIMVSSCAIRVRSACIVQSGVSPCLFVVTAMTKALNGERRTGLNTENRTHLFHYI